MPKETNRKRGSRKRQILVSSLLILLTIVLASWAFVGFSKDDGSLGDMPVFSVKRGPLKISITESGTIQAREKIIVKSEVEGRTSIIYLVDEGTRVKKGDLLVELDASALLDQKIDQEIRVQNAEAAFISAREALAVVENQAQSDVDIARLNYDFALQDLEKYTQGEYPNQLKEMESKITIAKEELTRARERLEWSRRLFEEGYISQTELQADELAEKKALLDLELVKNEQGLLKDFTHKRRLAQLESDVKQAKMSLERTIRKAKADVVQAKANLAAKESEYKRQQDKLQRIESQIRKTKIYAPADGLVIYATSADRGHRFGPRPEPLSEGATVQERQELIHLPTTSGFNAEIGVYEASLDKVKPGLQVDVKVDALPGERFSGRVVSIAPLPDPRSAFLNPDLKIYDTVIRLDDSVNTRLLRSGMSCNAEIIVAEYEDTVYVPVQAVLQVRGRPTVYVVEGGKIHPRVVETGLSNNSMIRIIQGLEPGELVSLAPPLSEAALDVPGPVTSTKGGAKGPATKGAPIAGIQGRSFGEAFIKTADKDGDNRVSRDEFRGPPEVFDRLDKDNDGYITVSEAPERVPPQGERQGQVLSGGLP
ncbi:MAG: efflux RND transporter periplasmic adaptor subunit [Deltaproteobacteria bacterium]|nr:efflux RND transporter periplasmic adaptor subunit [Deltaproteobacteria bacterium]MBW2128566.1 efflux RND transporter periplasmic adaptor subunit [Deltaproteobacteria bacterium]MBW2303310.1 efflux RND transporter periplasmic adaptor subunit [Deltaproteobacteria bacterium]